MLLDRGYRQFGEALRGSLRQELRCLFGRQWLREEKSLGHVAAHLPKQRRLRPVLHPLGNDFHPQGVGELYNRSYYRRVLDFLSYALSKRFVYLEDVCGQDRKSVV